LKKWPLKSKFLGKEDMHTLFLANNCEDAIKVIKKVHQDFLNGKEDFCLTHKKYRID